MFLVFERKCMLFLCTLPTASKNLIFLVRTTIYIYIYIWDFFFHFFSFFLALLCCWCSPCSAVLQLTGLAWSGALMWWCSELFLSPSLHCVSLTAVGMLRVIIRELLLYVLCSQQLWAVGLSGNASFLEDVSLGHFFLKERAIWQCCLWGHVYFRKEKSSSNGMKSFFFSCYPENGGTQLEQSWPVFFHPCRACSPGGEGGNNWLDLCAVSALSPALTAPSQCPRGCWSCSWSGRLEAAPVLPSAHGSVLSCLCPRGQDYLELTIHWITLLMVFSCPTSTI